MFRTLLLTSALVLTAAGCATTPPADCSASLPNNLDSAMGLVERKLDAGCAYQYDSYFDGLINVARENPDSAHRERFSEHLGRVQRSGLLSANQAAERFNQYFNHKFVAFRSEFNTCQQICPSKDAVLSNMERELVMKQAGLMEATRDSSRYQLADELMQESELVLEATCIACQAN